ncbi:MAG: peptidyl-prolyl cis-trans isomerase [Gammaproteobacteria bacterium]
MFALVRKSFFRKAVILLFILPLMFAGGSLVEGLAQDSVGSVESFDIPRAEFENTYRQMTEEYRRRYGVSEVSRELGVVIAREARDQLVTEYLMRAAVDEKEIAPPPSAVAREIRDYEEFHDDDGVFSFEIYSDYVPDRYRFEAQVARSLGREPLLAMIESYPLNPVRERLAAFRRQQRVVDETIVTVTASYNIPADDIRAYYDANQSDYLLRERADFEYLTVSFDAFAKTRVTVNDDDIAAAYEDYRAELAQRRRQKVSHIYIADESEDGYAKAEALAARAADGESFAGLAKEHSDDAGTAPNGGAFGFVAPGDLPEEMDAALAKLPVGGVSEPVEVDGGFSILRLDDSISPPPLPLAQVRGRMETRARRDIAYDAFADEAEKLREVAYRQVGSLLSVAALADTTVRRITGVLRRAGDVPPPFAVRAVRDQSFDEAIVSNGETGAIALEDDSFLFVRALDYQPRSVRPLAEVQESIEAILNAREQVRDMLAETETSGAPDLPAALEWSAPYTLNLIDEEEEETLSTEEQRQLQNIDEVFNADLSAGLPSYTMIPGDGEIRIFRIVEVINSAPIDEDFLLIDELINPAERNLAGAGYLEELSDRFNVRFDIPER